MSDLAIVFPGQGSQAVGMLADMAAAHDAVGETFEEASAALGYDLWELVQSGPRERLNQTEFTQPALLTASIALLRAWLAAGGSGPKAVAGHSLGEYSALVAAGVLEFADAVSLVQKRGRYMQSAVPLGVGSMGAILGLGDEEVVAICEACRGEETVQAVNFNAPGQVVIAGHVDAVNQAIERCKEAGARRAMPLAVSAPFHSDLMAPAADNMRGELDAVTFQAPQCTVVQNVDGQVETDPDRIRENLIRQIDHPVLWTATIERLTSLGHTTMIESGPGAVLSGLNRRIDRAIDSVSINTPDGLRDAVGTL